MWNSSNFFLFYIKFNKNISLKDPPAHAEILAMRQASLFKNSHRLDNCDIYITLEPCPMCAGAIAQSRISHLIFGAWDPKGGAVGSIWDVIRDPRALYKLDVTAGVREEECAVLLREFFEGQR